MNQYLSHSTTRWGSNETTPPLTHPTSSNPTPKGPTPVVRKPSPIVKSRPTICSGLPLCPIRKLSQETSHDDDNGDVLLLDPVLDDAGTQEIGLSGNNAGYYAHANRSISPASKLLTVSESFELPLYSLSPEQTKELKKKSDSPVHSVPSAGSGSKPPLSPKKKIKNKATEHDSGTSSDSATSALTITKAVMDIEPTNAMNTVQSNAVVAAVPAKRQIQTLNSYSLSENEKSLSSTEKSPSSDSSSPRSITDHITERSSRPATGRRTLSKTLGVDFRETAPIQPIRRPSHEPYQNNVITRPPLLPSFPSTSALIWCHNSQVSSSSSGSTNGSSDSQNSSNNNTIGTCSSLCSEVSAVSEATVKARNCYVRNVTATDAGTDPLPAPRYSNNGTATAPRARSLSFLPSPLEQVSEHSISEHSESTTTTTSPPVSSRKSRKKRCEAQVRIPTLEDGIENDEVIGIGIHRSIETAPAVTVRNSAQREIIFQPPTSPSALPVDHTSIIDRFEDGSPAQEGESKMTLHGRFMRILKNKFR
ncbi:hypothetical protein IV203_018297 [Nitzschia inconspicua]|uniref:Uncharacterized protein n=1 Tax=Nitzschia inconspicua TaxID=303405 RepID=A0A9K3M176_9STRA|nr:hypothetical protein IV203_018297 [Nitzschia inconspicua]